ncbi:MAG: M56 family metallopeptidase [bacterium]
MWLHLGWLLATGVVVVASLAVLSIRLLPHPVMQAFGVPCTAGGGCATLLPWWAQWGLWSVSVVILAGLLVRGTHSAVSGARAIIKTRRVALSAGHAITEEPWRTGFPSERLVVLDGPSTFAFTAGLFRPVIVLSSGLVHSLDPRELEAVVAHESAHVEGRDNLILLTAATIARSLWFLPGVELAHGRLRRVVELAADSHARGKVGDGLVVASSLHRFASLMVNRSPGNPRGANPVLAWFSEDGLIVERIGRLLDESDRAVSRFRIRLAFAVLAVVLLVFAVGTYRVSSVNIDPGSHATVCAGSTHAPGALPSQS